MPMDTSRPASAIVMSETVNIPLCDVNHAAPPPGQVHFSVAHIGWKNSTARILP